MKALQKEHREMVKKLLREVRLLERQKELNELKMARLKQALFGLTGEIYVQKTRDNRIRKSSARNRRP